jgi:hypothetical protein
MKDLVACGLLQSAELRVVLSGGLPELNQAVPIIRQQVSPHAVHFTLHTDNHYEFPGILALHEDSHSNPDGVMLYFHAKGMVFHNSNTRLQRESTLMRYVVAQWKDVLRAFEQPAVNKVCFGASSSGFCWFNFFWVRSTYLQNCSIPRVTHDRYYYESYLGTDCSPEQTSTDCYSMVANVYNKTVFTAPEISDILDQLA